MKDLNRIMVRLAAQERFASRDVVIHEVDFSSGQEPPDDYDDDFGTSITAEVTIGGKTLAQLLGRQQRVLGRALGTLKERQALSRLYNSRVGQEVLSQLKRPVTRLLQDFAYEEFERGVNRLKMDWTSDTDFWSARIDPRRETIKFEIELDVWGEWV